MSAEDYKTAVLEAYQGFHQGNFKPLMEILADDVEWVNHKDVPPAQTFHGHEGVAQYMNIIHQVELKKFELESLMCEGNKMFSVIKVGYKVKATGKSHSGLHIHLIEFKNGKVVRLRELGSSAAHAWS